MREGILVNLSFLLLYRSFEVPALSHSQGRAGRGITKHEN